MAQGVLFVPTDEQRRTVRAMAGYGMPQMDIGTFLDIDAKALRNHFARARNGLDRGHDEGGAIAVPHGD